MGPYEGDVTWSTEAINGAKRFVAKFYTFLIQAWEKRDDSLQDSSDVAKLIKKIEEDIIAFKFNTAISALMQFYNSNQSKKFSSKDIERLILTIAPILPHIAEELWDITGHEFSVHTQDWPEIDEKLLIDKEIEIPVQVNGKVKGKMVVSFDITQEDLEAKLLTDDSFAEIFKEQKPKKIIYIPQKIVSVVI
jgi:leucyl-tRNA synthetase